MQIKENIKRLIEEIPKDVILVAATKTRSMSEIREAIDSGLTSIGENYVQEAAKKIQIKEAYPNITFHLIGRLQSNKVKRAVEIFDMIQTVDSIDLAIDIDKKACEKNKIMPVLIEVNIAGEGQKNGCKKDELQSLAEKMAKLKNLELRGIMTMPLVSDEALLRQHFKEAKQAFDGLKTISKKIDTLSMGMSDSYLIAIEEGSTMVRIGTGIFGPR